MRCSRYGHQKDREKASTSTSRPHSGLRSDEPVFAFQEICIFCDDEASEEKEKNKIFTIKFIKFRPFPLRTKIEEKHNSGIAKAVTKQIMN